MYDEEENQRLGKKADDAIKKAFEQYEEYIIEVYDYGIRREQMIESFVKDCQRKLRAMYGYDTEDMKYTEYSRLLRAGSDIKKLLDNMLDNPSFCIGCKNLKDDKTKVENNICEDCKVTLAYF